MSRTVRRGQHDEVSRAEGGVARFAGLELFRLDDRVALITGGGGAIGTAMAGGLASAGIGARHPAEGYPLERWQTVLDINLTGTFLFLASDAASFVTGHILAVDGGHVAQ